MGRSTTGNEREGDAGNTFIWGGDTTREPRLGERGKAVFRLNEVWVDGVRSWIEPVIGSLKKGWSSIGEAGRATFSGEHEDDEKTTLVGDAGELPYRVVNELSRE